MSESIVVTGFGPFKGHPINASWENVKLLPKYWKNSNVKLIIDEIPVCYEFIQKQITAKWQDSNPTFFVHVGVSHLATAVTLETLAHNKIYDKPDIENKCPHRQCCVTEDCPDELFTMLDLEKIVKDLKGDQVTISTDPGRYLCDFVYYKSLHCSKGRSLFIHVPVLNKPFSEHELAQILSDVLQCICEQISQ